MAQDKHRSKRPSKQLKEIVMAVVKRADVVKCLDLVVFGDGDPHHLCLTVCEGVLPVNKFASTN